MSYPFPRERGDAESADRCRTFAWRAIAVYAFIFTTAIGVLVIKLLEPGLAPFFGAGR